MSNDEILKELIDINRNLAVMTISVQRTEMDIQEVKVQLIDQEGRIRALEASNNRRLGAIAAYVGLGSIVSGIVLFIVERLF